jgi:uncharacterized DUF497 family protein
MKRLNPVPASQEILEKIEHRHGIDFREVEELFQKPHLVLRGPVDQYGERRYTSLGETTAGRHLLVVYTVQERLRAKVITAREMMSRERQYYRRVFGSRRRK